MKKIWTIKIEEARAKLRQCQFDQIIEVKRLVRMIELFEGANSRIKI